MSDAMGGIAYTPGVRPPYDRRAYDTLWTQYLPPRATPRVEIEAPAHGLRIAVLPDAQVRKGVPTDHLAWYGRYISEKQPDVIVCIGDFADLPSLSTHARPGTEEAENQRYHEDLDSAYAAMKRFMDPIARVAGYNPRKILTSGNHEHRISRKVAENPRELKGRMAESDLRYEEFGWEVHPFLEPVEIGGVSFCHFFPAGVMGRPLSTAAGILRKYHQSCFAGHQQGRDIAYGRTLDRTITAIISGSFYTHDEPYLSKITNNHWRGAYFLHQVKDGQYDEMALSIDFLKRKFA